jgi:hypothetical protein
MVVQAVVPLSASISSPFQKINQDNNIAPSLPAVVASFRGTAAPIAYTAWCVWSVLSFAGGSCGCSGGTHTQYFAWTTWDSAFILLVDIIIIALSLVLQFPQIYS